jgi:eukaryotic-like serine/threonine-protein kinase
MTSQRWETVKQLFGEASDLPSNQRKEFIDAACPQDVESQELVLQLLGVFEPAVKFFDHLCAEVGSLANAPHSLLPGDVLVQRFSITRFLARGGMGEVYEARDLELGCSVALKLLRPSIIWHPGATDRFREELRLARMVSSPYVCRVYDFSRQRSADGTELYFYTMELLEGETLSALLRREGPMPLREAKNLINQMAEGLRAGHRLGILHRDFKSGNVMICTSKEGERRAVITDFGLAKTQDDGSFIRADRAATPAYVAPEQLAGVPQTPATDVYGLGVVIYEMVTGKLPFAGEALRDIVFGRLDELPDPPRRHRRDLNQRWDTEILRCLERDPTKRHQNTVDVAQALSRQQVLFSRRTWLATAAGGIGIAAAYVVNRSKRAPVGSQTSLAVLPFGVEAGDVHYLADGLADRLADSLTPVPGLRVVARSAAERAKDGDWKSLGRRLHVSHLVAGAMSAGENERIRVSAQVVEASTGFQLWSHTYDTSVQQIESMVGILNRAVIQSLQLKSPPQSDWLNQHLTQNPEAYQKYLLGRYHLARRLAEDLQAAQPLFEEALRLDPNFAAASAALAYTLHQLSYDDNKNRWNLTARSLAEAQRAITINPKIAEAYLVIGLNQDYWQWDWERAEENYKKALELDSGNIDARRAYASLLSIRARHDEALRQVEEAMERDPLDPRLGVQRGMVLLNAGRITESIAQHEAVVQSDPDYRNVYIPLSDSFAANGQIAEAIEACKKGVALSGRMSYTIAQLGRLYALAGRTTDAAGLLNELQERYRNHEASAGNVAMVFLGLRDKDDAFEWLDRGLAAHDTDLDSLKVGQEFEFLRPDPRYQSLLARTRL